METNLREISQQAMEPPAFDVPLKNSEAEQGEHVIFSCVVSGVPAPDVHWFHNHQDIKDKEDFVVAYDEETGHAELVIVQCLAEDAGEYHCVASNPVGEALTSADLTVTCHTMEDVVFEELEPEQDLSTVTENITEPEELKDSVMEESILPDVNERKMPPPGSVSPQPEVYSSITELDVDASKESDIQAIEEEAISATPRAKIIDLREPNLKTYQALEGQTEESIVVMQTEDIITVESTERCEPAQFVRPIQPVVVKETQDGVFSAVVRGLPLPSVNWLRDDVLITPSDRFTVALDDSLGVATFTIHQAQPGDFGNYTCIATNSAGRAKCTANLVVVREYKVYQFITDKLGC